VGKLVIRERVVDPSDDDHFDLFVHSPFLHQPVTGGSMFVEWFVGADQNLPAFLAAFNQGDGLVHVLRKKGLKVTG
jgi:hypothetical protein